ncbi:MAG: hypothetical protein AAGH92_08080 [Planctomycetota bacterium]
MKGRLFGNKVLIVDWRRDDPHRYWRFTLTAPFIATFATFFAGGCLAGVVQDIVLTETRSRLLAAIALWIVWSSMAGLVIAAVLQIKESELHAYLRERMSRNDIRCSACGYPLRTPANESCPECGSETPLLLSDYRR